MELAVGPAALALALALLLLCVLYGRCGSFRFFCKMGFYNGWILLLALLAVPLCALRGRHVHNMRIIRGLLQHVKHLYGIQMSRELLYMGAVGLVCWLGGIIFIDRKRTSDAISVMAEAARAVRVWVFPEGTRNHSGSMLPFKRGAFHLAVQAQVPVVPIVISSYRHFYCKSERRFNPGRCVIQVLPPLPTAGLGPEDVPALTERVRAAMLEAFEGLERELGPTAPGPTAGPTAPGPTHGTGSDPHTDPRHRD
ncbi:hypothetical protein Q9233_017491 [Columba guinea]|nr:hypothetical protein Q9233_017491 [Columba guinea]